MFSKTFIIVTVSLLLIGGTMYGDGIAGEAKKGPAAEALQNVGPTLAKT